MNNNAPDTTKDIRFYHYTTTPLHRALGDLLIKALEKGHRAIILTQDEAQTKTLDEGLWTFKQEAFLDHGHGSDPAPERTRIWISHDVKDIIESPNKADLLVITNGQTIEETWPYTLICDFFDGHDTDKVNEARARWSHYRGENHTLSYFQQDQKGTWVTK